MGPGALIMLILAGVSFSAGGIVVAKFLFKKSTGVVKGEPYECGVKTIGPSWVQFPVGYYLFALVFLVFDVELIFLYPWAVVVKSVGMFAFIEIVIFLFILFLGLLYAHKKGALKWM